MVGQFFKSFGLAILLAIIGGIYFAIGYVMLQVLQENWTAIIILFFIFMFITYIFTKLDSLIWRGMNFMYYFWILAATVGMYVLFLSKENTMGESSWLYYIVGEFTLLFFIVPECSSYWTHYLVTTYIDDVEVDHYFTKEYTSGTLVKMGFMALGTAIFCLTMTFLGKTGFIIVFVLHCLYLGVMFLVGLFGYRRSRY